MCGIVGYIGYKPYPINYFIELAHKQKHRGNKDGIGIVYKEDNKLKVHKLMIKLKEKKKLFKEFKDIKSNYVFIHHRKATQGSVNLINTHPIQYKNNIYIHNGTVDTYTLKRFLEVSEHYKQITDTDTELLLNIIDRFGFNNARYIFEEIGVIIKLEKNKITIIKDDARPLYMYILSHGYLFISEPIADKTFEFKDLYYIKSGEMEISHNDLIIDGFYVLKNVTNKAREFLSKKIMEIKSDCCDVTKKCIRIDGKDYCMDCFLQGVKIKG